MFLLIFFYTRKTMGPLPSAAARPRFLFRSLRRRSCSVAVGIVDAAAAAAKRTNTAAATATTARPSASASDTIPTRRQSYVPRSHAHTATFLPFYTPNTPRPSTPPPPQNHRLVPNPSPHANIVTTVLFFCSVSPSLFSSIIVKLLKYRFRAFFANWIIKKNQKYIFTFIFSFVGALARVCANKIKYKYIIYYLKKIIDQK